MHDILASLMTVVGRLLLPRYFYYFKNKYIHKQDKGIHTMSIPKSSIYELEVSIILLMRQ